MYEWFVRPYTQKQWGVEPSRLSAAWAPKRLEIRDDGYTDLFRDPYQGWPEGGYTEVIDALLSSIAVHMGVNVDASTVLEEARAYDRVVLTVPLDTFFADALGPLPWRGVRLQTSYFPDVEHVLPCGVVNHPAEDEQYTRRIETKWMSGQEVMGTVVSKEYPGSAARHYPIDDADGDNRRLANAYIQLVRDELGPRFLIAGRLATYTYIDMDQSMRQGLNVATSAVRPSNDP
jgi:UDP-galactopyranose mutase